MHPFFFGMGPAFLSECEVPPFETVDLLPLFCEILEIQCPEVNGTLFHLQKCLRKYHYEAILYKGICKLYNYIILFYISKQYFSSTSYFLYFVF